MVSASHCIGINWSPVNHKVTRSTNPAEQSSISVF